VNWKRAITDPDGDVNIAEVIAATGGFIAVVMPVIEYFQKGLEFHMQDYGTTLGMIIGALGCAQRLRGDADNKDGDKKL